MYQSNGAYNFQGMMVMGLLDGIKSVGAVALDSFSNGIIPSRKRDQLTAAEMTYVGPIARLLGSDAFPNPWGEDGLGMSSGWAKGMDIASILAAFVPGLLAAKTSTTTATNSAAGSVARVAPKIKVPKLPSKIAPKSISALTPEAKAFAMADIDAQAIAAIKSADTSMISIPDKGFSFNSTRAKAGLDAIESGDKARIATSTDVIWETVQSQREALLRAKYPKADLTDVKTFNQLYGQEFYGLGKDDIIKIFKGGYGDSVGASWRTGTDALPSYFSTNPYVAAEYARFKEGVLPGQELSMFSMDVPISQLTKPFGQGASSGTAQGSLEFPQIMYGPMLAAQTPKPYDLPSQVYSLMSSPTKTTHGRYWPYDDGLFGGGAPQAAAPWASTSGTISPKPVFPRTLGSTPQPELAKEKFGLSSILSRMFKPSQQGHGQEIYTKEQIRRIMELAAVGGPLKDPTFNSVNIKRMAPWHPKAKTAAGFYSPDKHSITLPWAANSTTVVHEGVHALDFTKHHWSYENLFRHLHATGRPKMADSLTALYQRSTAPGMPATALYDGIQSGLYKHDFALYARFRGYLEGNADDITHQIGKKLKDEGDIESAKKIGSPYAGGGAYFNSLLGLLKASKDPGYQYIRNPNWLEGLLESSPTMPPHVRARLESYVVKLKEYKVDGFSEDDFGNFGELFQDSIANGWARGGSIPKFHNGGQVNTKFAGGETMALLKDKEMVFTQDQMRALGSVVSVPSQSTPTSITYAPVINAAPGMDEEMLANLVMVKLGTATNIRYKANGSSGMRVIK
jgi:hypothetical protein